MKVACVFGTYNRKQHLVPALESVRRAAGLPITFIVVDGGSKDGSREWLAGQKDVVLLGQRGELTGAVRAFNLGFAYAVDEGFNYVLHFNDDAELTGPSTIAKQVARMEADPSIGALAFAFDLRGSWDFDRVHGKVYSNFGMIRREAGMAVARAQGDAAGRLWWNPIYRTYGADCELGCWLWKLGWKVVQTDELRVHDKNHKDELRKLNQADNPDRPDAKLFWSRWPTAEMLAPVTAGREWNGARVHLGCGDKRLPASWVNVDGIQTPAADVVGDVFELFRSIPEGSLVQVYSSHFVEHIYPDKLPELLKLIHRALARGGRLTLATIDFEKIFYNRFKTAKNGSAWNAAIYGETNSNDHPYAAHRQCFTNESLCGLLRDAGFGILPWALEDYPEIMALNDYALSCRLVTCFAEGVK